MGRRSMDNLRTLTAFLPVPGDPAALARVLESSPSRWLPLANAPSDDGFVLTVHGAGLTREVIARIGAAWRSDTTVWRAISWDPMREAEPGDRGARLLPSFDGELGLFVAGAEATLALEGSYVAPGGPFGAALDGLALGRVARGTAERLLADIAARLTAGSMHDATS